MSRDRPPGRSPGATLSRYVAREIWRPVCFALIGLTLIILIQDLLGFSDLVINRGVGMREVLGIAFAQAVPVAARMFPFALLVGTLVGLGRLGADREILVLEASGISASRLIGPVARFALAMTALSLLLSLLAAPAANRALDASLERISRQQPWANFRPGSVSEFGGWKLAAREVSARGDELRSVLLFMPDIAETIFARSGRVATSPSGDVELTLEQGRLVPSPRNGGRQLGFQTLRTELPASDEGVTRSATDRLAGLSFEALAERSDGFVASPEQPVSRARVELNRRIATPPATLLFGLLAVPLFLTRRNFSRSGGSVLGVLATVAYFVLVQFGEGLAETGALSAVAGVWFPNFVVALVAGLLFVRARREGVLGHAFDRPQLSERGFGILARIFSSHAAGRPRRRALQRYVIGYYIELVAISFLVLLAAYLLIDVMERLDWFARYRATGFEVLRFYLARLPLLASRVVPMALLIGTALVVSLLAVEGELTGMRACGISAPRALLPVLLLTLAVAPAYFLLRNVVVPRTNALADELKQTEIKAEAYREISERRKSHVWRRSGGLVLEAARFDAEGGQARDLTIYELGDDGLPVARTDAWRARHVGRGVWRLVDPQRVEIGEEGVREVPASLHIELGDTLEAEVDTMHLSVGQLAREIEAVEGDGYDATQLRVDYHVKLADALACVVMPASVLFFAVAGPPFPGPAQTLMVSGVIAVSYLLFTGIGASLGYGGRVSPIVGGWAPVLIFSALAAFLALRLYNRRL